MSLQSKYRLERDGISVFENDEYFFAYQIFENEFQIQEVYIKEDLRGNSKFYFEKIIDFIKKHENISFVVGYIIPGVVGSEQSMRSLLSFNFKIHSAENNKITLVLRL